MVFDAVRVVFVGVVVAVVGLEGVAGRVDGLAAAVAVRPLGGAGLAVIGAAVVAVAA